MHSGTLTPEHGRLVDEIRAIVWEADPRTLQFLYVSRHAEAVLRYPISDWLTRPAFWMEVLQPNHREAAGRKWLQSLEVGANQQIEYRAIAADGSIRQLLNIVTVKRNAVGEIERVCGLMVESSEPPQPEASSQVDWYQRVALEHGLDVTAITDRSGVIKWVSPSVHAVLGAPASALPGRIVFEFVHPDDISQVERVFATAFGTQRPTVAVLVRARHADGSWRTLEAVGRSVDGDEGAVAVINARDVTARVRLEAELRRAQKMEALARITSAVAHDFNNLLAVIHGNVDLALHSIPDAHLYPELTEILQAAELGKGLTGQLSTFAGRRRRLTIVDVNTTVREARTILERILRPTASLTIDTAATRSRVPMEGGALQQVLLNLAVNAREAMDAQGRVAITTRNVSVSAGPDDAVQDCVEIEVTDTGIGMTAGVRDQVFELYFTTKEDTRGSGIGLATVYAVVRDAGGTITVDSEPGQGSTFRIRLPLVKDR